MKSWPRWATKAFCLTLTTRLSRRTHPYATRTRRIVCGDFNDTPLSYTYRLMSRGLQDAFREKGRGFSHTYRGFYNTFRIDYVLVSDDFEVLSYEVPSVEFSDHHPVFVRLKYNSQRQ